LASLVALSPRLAHAGGKEFPDNGAQALSRGGAFTAKADDLTALEYNVAGLAMVRGTRLQVDANLLFASVDFDRAGTYPQNGTPYDNAPFPRVSNQGGPRLTPFFGVASDFGTRTLAFAAGLYGPSAYGRFRYPDTVRVGNALAPAPQRYDLEEGDITVGYPTFAVAWRPTGWLAVGGAFHWVFVTSTFREKVYLPPAQPRQEDPDYDFGSQLDTSQTFAPSASFGLLVRLAPWVDLGLAWRLSTDLDLDGNLTLVPAKRAPPINYEPGKNAAEAHVVAGLPSVLRGGARYRFLRGGVERADLELDFTYERWGATPRDIVITLSGLTPAPRPFHHAQRYDDTLSVRVGGACNWDPISLRVGAFYDSSAVGDGFTRLDFLPLDHVGLAGGLGYSGGPFTFDLGLAYVIIPERTVTQSQLRQLDALGGPNEDAQHSVIGNGRYSGSYTVVTAGVGARF
jgi:long-chain fatty acid transport protein